MEYSKFSFFLSNATALDSIFLRAKSAKIGHFLGPLLNKYYLPINDYYLPRSSELQKWEINWSKIIDIKVKARNNESEIVSAVKYVGKLI